MALKLTKELLTTIPEKIAKELNLKKDATKNQIRKFYNDFLVLKRKSDLAKSEEDFVNNILPLICFSKAKLAYACGRENISMNFVKIINSYIDKIDNQNDFEVFMSFYEALIGYVTFFEKYPQDKAEPTKNINPRRW